MARPAHRQRRRPGDRGALQRALRPNPADSVPWQIKQVWDADDDTDVEYLALHTLFTCGLDCNSTKSPTNWLEHMTADGIYVANKQAWRLMLDGYTPPETGSRTL